MVNGEWYLQYHPSTWGHLCWLKYVALAISFHQPFTIYHLPLNIRRDSGGGCGDRLLKVGEDVVDVFEADGEAN